MKKPLCFGRGAAIVKPATEQITPDVPKPVVRDALLAADRNRWFYVSVGLLVLCLLLGLQTMQANKRFAENVRVAWVKMSPSGTWDIEFHDESRGADFYPATIDYMLAQFVERRYSKVRNSIKTDYGFSLQFMAPQMARTFIDSEQFNAAGVVAEFLEQREGAETFIKVGPIDHYDSDITNFAGSEGTLYRTNIFVTENKQNKDGSLAADPVPRIVSIQWRIKSKGEVAGDKNMLRINPIGLEVIKSEILDDPSKKLKG